MAEIASTTGVKIYLGPVNSAANDETAYGALTYTEIQPVESIGEFGDSAAMVNFTALSDGRVRKLKGVNDAGDLSVVVGDSPRDPGQLAANAAAKTAFSYALKVVLADAPDTNDTDSTFFMRVKVMSSRLNVGAANAVVTRTYQLAIDSEIIEVPSEAVS